MRNASIALAVLGVVFIVWGLSRPKPEPPAHVIEIPARTADPETRRPKPDVKRDRMSPEFQKTMVVDKPGEMQRIEVRPTKPPPSENE